MALDRPFGDGRVQAANVAVSASTLSVNITDDLSFMFRAKRPFTSPTCQTHETAETGVSDHSEGGGRQQSFTHAAPNELKLGEGR